MPDQRKLFVLDKTKRSTLLIQSAEYGLLELQRTFIMSVKRTTHEYGTTDFHKV